jgi:hypothetical protein
LSMLLARIWPLSLSRRELIDSCDGSIIAHSLAHFIK